MMTGLCFGPPSLAHWLMGLPPPGALSNFSMLPPPCVCGQVRIFGGDPILASVTRWLPADAMRGDPALFRAEHAVSSHAPFDPTPPLSPLPSCPVPCRSPQGNASRSFHLMLDALSLPLLATPIGHPPPSLGCLPLTLRPLDRAVCLSAASPRAFPRASPRCLSAANPLPLRCLSAASPLPLRCLSALPLRAASPLPLCAPLHVPAASLLPLRRTEIERSSRRRRSRTPLLSTPSEAPSYGRERRRRARRRRARR